MTSLMLDGWIVGRKTMSEMSKAAARIPTESPRVGPKAHVATKMGEACHRHRPYVRQGANLDEP
jgi:hypothetical protein